MASTSKLSVYNDTMAFIVVLYGCVENFRKFDKGVLGARLLNESLDLIVYIALANRDKEKRELYLTRYLSKLECIKANLKLCEHFKTISHNKIELIGKQVHEIEAQATAWKNSANKSDDKKAQ